MDTCAPLAPGTILRTMSGTEFRLLAEHTVGGNAILYRAKQIDSQLDVTLKELCPPGSHRAGGILVSRSAGDVLLQRKADKLLKERAAEEFGSGQSINNETLHALLTLGLLDIRSIQEPDGTVYQNADGTSLPCVFLYMPTLNKAKGFFLRELLEECAAFPHSETHPLGNRQDIVEPETTTPDVLTCLRIVGLLLEALQSIHKTWIHGDISLDNLFVDGDLHLARPRGVFLLDFGSARPLDASGKTALIHTGDALYTTNVFSAPEINDFRQNGTPLQLTAAADVYSVGRLLRLLLNSEALCAIREGNAISLTLQMTDTNLCELDVDRSARPFLNELNGILRAAAEKDPAQRISVNDMLTKINALISRLTAVRSPLMENLSSPEVFIPHSRDTELKELDEKIHSPERPIFLWGQGGLGKTETARAFLLQCKQKGLRVAFFSYEHSVRDTILNLKFTNFQMPSFFGMTPEQQEEALYQTKLGLLAEMGENSVIVMDNFDSDFKTFDELRQESAYQDLISICGPHLVITTRFEPDSDAVEIRPLADEILLKLMLKEMDVKEIHDSGLTSTLHDIIDAIQGHTLTCYLIAKSIKHSLGRLSAQDVLNALNQYNLHSLPQLVSSDKDRKYTKTTIYGHLKVLFDLSKMTGVYRTVLCHTVLLPQKGLDSTMFFDGETQEEQFALTELVERGWVQHIHLNSNTHLLSIHPLIKELIVNELGVKESDILPFVNRLWAQFDAYHFNRDQLFSHLHLAEAAQNYIKSVSSSAEIQYRIGLFYLTLSERLPPCKENIAYDYYLTTEYLPFCENSANELDCWKYMWKAKHSLEAAANLILKLPSSSESLRLFIKYGGAAACLILADNRFELFSHYTVEEINFFLHLIFYEDEEFASRWKDHLEFLERDNSFCFKWKPLPEEIDTYASVRELVASRICYEFYPLIWDLKEPTHATTEKCYLCSNLICVLIAYMRHTTEEEFGFPSLTSSDISKLSHLIVGLLHFTRHIAINVPELLPILDRNEAELYSAYKKWANATIRCNATQFHWLSLNRSLCSDHPYFARVESSEGRYSRLWAVTDNNPDLLAHAINCFYSAQKFWPRSEHYHFLAECYEVYSFMLKKTENIRHQKWYENLKKALTYQQKFLIELDHNLTDEEKTIYTRQYYHEAGSLCEKLSLYAATEAEKQRYLFLSKQYFKFNRFSSESVYISPVNTDASHFSPPPDTSYLSQSSLPPILFPLNH